MNSVICLFWADLPNEFWCTPKSRGQILLAYTWFCDPCFALYNFPCTLCGPLGVLAWMWPWSPLPAPGSCLPLTSHTETGAKWCLHLNPVLKTSCQPVTGEELHIQLPLPRLMHILWVSDFCLSLEFLISSSSFSDSVLISFDTAFSFGNIQASAYSILLNTQVNIHRISVALFSSSLNKLSCLLLEATMSPFTELWALQALRMHEKFLQIYLHL